ncbi:cupin domain-containing protein [Methylorubrum thiocyanatum]|uniref:cupin domain-containing protein n=1 Tax=Methylorubrum thiocyanatum TaxID=47958 RepID=UPI00383A2EF4
MNERDGRQAPAPKRAFRTRGIAVLAALFVLVGPDTGRSQEKPMTDIKRTELSRAPVSGVEGKEIVVQLVEFPVGATSPRHFHNGEEVFYVLEGGTISVPGKGEQDRVAGQHGINLRGVPHAGYTVAGDKTIKILSVYVVDKDKPLQVPAP